MNRSARRCWKISEQKTLYEGFYKIESVKYSHSLHSGDMTGPIDVELFVRGDVVGLLPYDPVSDQVALIEQFRIGAMHNKPDPWLVQIIAGMIDTDETPEQVVIREAKEEAGIELVGVELISRYIASPGASTEEVYVFYAETDLSQVGGTHGLMEEDEDILVKVMSADDAIALLDNGEIKNALSIIALQWFKLKRQCG
ncbi:MAG: ADP-ribose pyrophosphatase [Porticoccaceae bacterium]|jgi:ADP-ribose pyrophosphatase